MALFSIGRCLEPTPVPAEPVIACASVESSGGSLRPTALLDALSAILMLRTTGIKFSTARPSPPPPDILPNGGCMQTASVKWIGEEKFVAIGPSGHAVA